MTEMSNLGRKPKDAKQEYIPHYAWDTIILNQTDATNKKATLQKHRLFEPGVAKKNVLKNTEFPLPEGKAFQITHMRIEHNINMDDPQSQALFESFGNIKWVIEDKNYSPMPISQFLSYNRHLNGGHSIDNGTPVSKVDVVNQVTGKDGSFSRLPQPITLPYKGQIELEFDPGIVGALTKEIEGAFAAHFGKGVVDSQDSPVMYMKFTFLGNLLRQA